MNKKNTKGKLFKYKYFYDKIFMDNRVRGKMAVN